MNEPFRTSVRVQFGDTDMAGIVHFANFFRYMEVAETDFWRSLGGSVSWPTDRGRHGLPRVSASCDYFKPALFEDVLEIAVSVEKVGTKSVTMIHEFRRDEELLARGRVTSVYCRTEGGVVEALPLPDEVRARLARFT